MYDDVKLVVEELISTHLSGQDLLRLKVTSNSMAPLLRSGDYVLLRPAPVESLNRGDILVTRQEGGYLTHRVVAITDQSVQTKGDMNKQADAQTDKKNIVGLVEVIERRGRVHRLDTRSQVLLARILGKLSLFEINSHSKLSIWAPRIIARVLLYLFH